MNDSLSLRRKAHRDYAREYSLWFMAQTPAVKRRLAKQGLDKPLPFEGGKKARCDEDSEFADPGDLAVVQSHLVHDERKPIVDFAAVTFEELDALTDHFGKALEWATRMSEPDGGLPNLLVMGGRMLTIINVMYPKVAGGKRLPARAMKQHEFELRGVLLGVDPLVTGDLFRRPLAWVSDAASLEQLGQRGYSMIMNMHPELVDGMTCAELGAFKNDTRQATNKPLNDFRDTFSGIKSLTMRDEETRKRCRRAQS